MTPAGVQTDVQAARAEQREDGWPPELLPEEKGAAAGPVQPERGARWRTGLDGGQTTTPPPSQRLSSA